MLGSLSNFLGAYTNNKLKLPIRVTQNIGYSYFLVITANIVKLVMGAGFAMGDRSAGHYLIYFIYPLRLVFYYNPLNEKNQGPVQVRNCCLEFQAFLLMLTCVLLVLSSHRFGPSRRLRLVRRSARRTMRRAGPAVSALG